MFMPLVERTRSCCIAVRDARSLSPLAGQFTNACDPAPGGLLTELSRKYEWNLGSVPENVAIRKVLRSMRRFMLCVRPGNKAGRGCPALKWYSTGCSMGSRRYKQDLDN
ncbi:hypothetical protein DSTSK_03700 [Desulforhabdus sp. TSK]|nr:hypothetical protein DSTSK_03700 [Desulforhabdus sp. TSK]